MRFTRPVKKLSLLPVAHQRQHWTRNHVRGLPNASLLARQPLDGFLPQGFLELIPEKAEMSDGTGA